MPVSFLNANQRENYGCYTGRQLPDDLCKYFYLDDVDLEHIAKKRNNHTRLGWAIQLTTVRFLGAFPEDPTLVPRPIIQILAKQLAITNLSCLRLYKKTRWCRFHKSEIRALYGYRDFSDPIMGFRLSRWLYSLCWTGTDRPSVLFERVTDWLLTHRVLLPGASVLERFVAQVRTRVETRIWNLLARDVTIAQQVCFEELLMVPEGCRGSLLDQLRSGPVRASGPALVKAIHRLQNIRDLGIKLPPTRVVPSRLASLARFAHTAKIGALARLPQTRRIATFVAFMHCIEATAHDDVLEVLEILLTEIFSRAKKADKEVRFRSLKDLDQAATLLADACDVLTNPDLPGKGLRKKVYQEVPLESLTTAITTVRSLVRPPQDVYFQELQKSYRRISIFLPMLVKHIRFGSTPVGKSVVLALDWIRDNIELSKPGLDAPMGVVNAAWMPHVSPKDSTFNFKAYVFCTLDRLRALLKRREIFVSPSWRYADPRAPLLKEAEWGVVRPVICRTLGLTPDPKSILTNLTTELKQTYLSVIEHLPENPAIRFEIINNKNELILSPLDKLEESSSLVHLKKAVMSRMPRVDLPEVVLEIAARTGFTNSFTQVTEREIRASGLDMSLCAVLLSEACNTGPESFVRSDVPALTRDRLAWVKQNYIRDETLAAANAALVSAQDKIDLAHVWGRGEVASADGMRFVVPVKTIHAGFNPKYFGPIRGVTWYNMMSDQFTGLNAMTVTGTLRDSLILLAVLLEQQTELRPTTIMTDTGAYSDIIFGLFYLLGYYFSPRLADIGGTRFWRIESDFDYGPFNDISKHPINMQLITENWDDLLRLAASLKLGYVSAIDIMRTLYVGDNPTRLAKALAELGRIEKTLHSLKYIDNEDRRRVILTQLNHTESRHSMAREIFHGKRGELRQRYREGQEDQLGALGLILNTVVHWNTTYMDAAIKQLRLEEYPINENDLPRLPPLIRGHIHMLGRYSLVVPEEVTRGELRPLRNPNEES